MQALTAFGLAAFGGYAGSWYFGMVEGNFALLLFLATLVTGVYWLAERFHFLPARQKAAALLEAQAAGLPVVAAEDALSCVALGTGRALEDIKRLRHVLTSMY